MKSFQNLILLRNLYRLKAIGYTYTDSFFVNEKNSYIEALTLNELYKNIATCHLCDLSKSRKQSMCGYGNPNATLMIIDYSVSSAQDSNNTYYCGNSGESLVKMINNVLELKVEDVYYTHAIKCKPLNSNKPSHSEWSSCKNYLFSQIEFIKPKVIVTLGEETYSKITGEKENFQEARGHIINFKNYKLIPLYHPSFLLRNPELKKAMFNDLKSVKSCLAL